KVDEKYLDQQVDMRVVWWMTKLRDVNNRLLYVFLGAWENVLTMYELEAYAQRTDSERKLKQVLKIALEQQQIQLALDAWSVPSREQLERMVHGAAAENSTDAKGGGGDEDDEDGDDVMMKDEEDYDDHVLPPGLASDGKLAP